MLRWLWLTRSAGQRMGVFRRVVNDYRREPEQCGITCGHRPAHRIMLHTIRRHGCPRRDAGHGGVGRSRAEPILVRLRSTRAYYTR